MIFFIFFKNIKLKKMDLKRINKIPKQSIKRKIQKKFKKSKFATKKDLFSTVFKFV